MEPCQRFVSFALFSECDPEIVQSIGITTLSRQISIKLYNVVVFSAADPGSGQNVLVCCPEDSFGQFASSILQSIKREFLRFCHPRPTIVRPRHKLERIRRIHQDDVPGNIPFLTQNLACCGRHRFGRDPLYFHRHRPAYLERTAGFRLKTPKLLFLRRQEIARWS